MIFGKVVFEMNGGMYEARWEDTTGPVVLATIKPGLLNTEEKAKLFQEMINGLVGMSLKEMLPEVPMDFEREV